jgi:4-alpha-glucanotransferase
VPLQDVLGVGSEGRMNLPGRPGGNWRWRYGKDALTPAVRSRLESITVASGRQGAPRT